MNRPQNQPEPEYWAKLDQIARFLREQNRFVVVSHVDPDGDAIGSSLGLSRALRSLGKQVWWVAEPPRYLKFLAEPQEASPPVRELPEGAILVVLDAAEPSRVAGAPVEGRIVNIDHHGTNPRFGELSVVDPSKAATAHIVKDLIDLMGVSWTQTIATPILTGLLTDTGNFRFSNTTPETLECAADLLKYGVPLAELTDRLQWRPPSYYALLARVLSTVRFQFGGLLVSAHLTGGEEEDSDDFVGLIRYAEGSRVAVFLREREGKVKVSIRSRGEVSAQAIALRLGGGGHVPAAGATLEGVDLAEAYRRVEAAVEEELRAKGLWGD